MRISWRDRLLPKSKPKQSYLRSVVAGSLYRISDIHSNTSIADIHTQIDTMRALALDSQISTALSFYATDATTVNTVGQIIWATPIDDKYKDIASIINTKFKQWNINAYARDHILELATIGNLYIPTTLMYNEPGKESKSINNKTVALDDNSIVDENYDIIPSTQIRPEEVVHLWYQGKPEGYIYQPEEQNSAYTLYPEGAIIHFSLGGLIGKYSIDTTGKDGTIKTYDIQFAQPLMEKAVQPTQTLSLLEDANVLSSLSRIVKFINVECGSTDEDEIKASLSEIKDAIEQQLSINTNTGDAQSFVNPQSPNNLIYLPKINGQDAVSITDLKMTEHTEGENKLLEYYQDKKLSVLGVPKEAMNFSSNEGLGGAGSVLSQRSAIYANSLLRLATAYTAGWTAAFNKYFEARGLSGYRDKFVLHMNPIITPLATVQSEKRDASLNQATTLVQMLKDLGVKDADPYISAIKEILTDAFPGIGTDVNSWKFKVDDAENGGGGDAI